MQRYEKKYNYYKDPVIGIEEEVRRWGGQIRNGCPAWDFVARFSFEFK